MTKQEQKTSLEASNSLMRTKLGWLPVEWKVERLDSLFSFKNGVNAGKEYYGKGVKFINVSEIFNNNSIQADAIPGSVAVSEDVVEKYAVKRGDVLFNRTSETQEEIAFAAVYLDDEKVVFGGFVIRARSVNDKMNDQFKKYCFQSSLFRKQVMAKGQGAVRANIGQNDLGTVKIPLPPLPEQQKIATILSTWDRAITLTRQLLQEKEAQKKGLMQRLLTGKVRVKGFEGEWDALELGQLFSLSSGKTKPNNTRSSSTKNINKPVYGGNGIMGYTDKSLLSGDKILIGRVGEYCGCVHVANGDYWVTDNCLFTKEFHHSTSINFLAYFLDFKQLKRFRNKGGQPLISQKSILKLKFPIPQIKEQTAIAAILTQADEEIRLLREKERALQAQKKGLMQRLLMGKVRVKVD
jgi:type I restriction enzyme S subunit